MLRSLLQCIEIYVFYKAKFFNKYRCIFCLVLLLGMALFFVTAEGQRVVNLYSHRGHRNTGDAEGLSMSIVRLAPHRIVP